MCSVWDPLIVKIPLRNLEMNILIRWHQGMNFYTPTVFRSIGFDGTKVVLLASGWSSSALDQLWCLGENGDV